LKDLEEELLNGQKLQGPETAKELNVLLKQKNLEARYEDLFYFFLFLCTKLILMKF
jgi:glycerol-3-phosphate dehydrogenase (NAD+)